MDTSERAQSLLSRPAGQAFGSGGKLAAVRLPDVLPDSPATGSPLRRGSPALPLAATADDAGVNRACYVVAFVVTVGWFFIYNHFRPDYLVDEGGHLGAVYHFLEGKPGWPEHVTMLPGYHFIIAALWQLQPPLKLLTLARLVTLITALISLASFACAWRRVHNRPAGRATLLLALLPLLQPFTGMAYSDAPALAFVLVAFLAHIAGHRLAAAGLFVASALIRQTNLVWAGYLMVWEGAKMLRPPPGRLAGVGAGGMSALARGREFLARTGWLGLVLALAVVIVAIAGRVTLGTQTGTAVQGNMATLHTAALLILLFGLPVWVASLPRVLRQAHAWLRASPVSVLALMAGGVAAAWLLAVTFRNPHQWNRDLFWDGCTFTLLRNWPLVWIDTHPWLRVASGVNVVLMAVAVTATFARQPRRLELWLSLAFGAVLPALNYLVEPRYFIPGFVFILFFLEWEPAHWRRTAIWWALLCVLHAPFVARGLSLW